MAVEELTLANHSYRIGVRKLNAMEQFHVTRKLGPALVIAGVTFKALMEGVKVSIEDWVAIAGPVMDVISRMSNEDVEYIIFTCLKAAERLSGGNYAPVLAADGRQLMFADMDQGELLQLTLAVLRDNLENFFKGMNVGAILSGSSETNQSPDSTART